MYFSNLNYCLFINEHPHRTQIVDNPLFNNVIEKKKRPARKTTSLYLFKIHTMTQRSCVTSFLLQVRTYSYPTINRTQKSKFIG